MTKFAVESKQLFVPKLPLLFMKRLEPVALTDLVFFFTVDKREVVDGSQWNRGS
jgi:hypothetical protein